MDRYLSLRFDVDTELCLREGVPRLLALGEELNCRFTFFVNPGRAIARDRLLAESFRPRSPRQRAPCLGALRKLGCAELAYLVCLNPRGLPRHASVVRRAWEAGHEIGLHGGRNHGLWQRDAQYWSVSRIHDEIRWGKAVLHQCGVSDLQSFASPGWNAPKELPDILEREGFSIWADVHGNEGKPYRIAEHTALTEVPTTLSGEPGGVGYLECCRASGDDEARIITRVLDALSGQHSFLCLYDHPFYAGRHELDTLRSIIEEARSTGWMLMPMRDAVDRLVTSPA